MHSIIFCTSNKRKLAEATAACRLFDIKVVHQQCDIDEIQSHDPIAISEHKAEQAFELIRQPVVINDTFWEIPALNGFPGGYMKDVTQWFEPQDFIDLMQNKTDRRACITECVVFKGDNLTKTITKQYWGEIALQPKGIGNSIEQVAIFNGKTFGEHAQQGNPPFAPEEYVWHDFAKWYINKG